ncbi:hypothetical protein I7I53_00129 [Histoplasma capsulatum var. duboisii H88]|uniref:Uncharacterized protein n=1 Tax=Ajellomyces capsulatus (strain H88) TaxID=544711 RepID=A0A8A1LGK3_AJEC8|nr:hypothetical protein I7I53_00129 [Histoplasma capsulatum var. duboisii H88]
MCLAWIANHPHRRSRRTGECCIDAPNHVCQSKVHLASPLCSGPWMSQLYLSFCDTHPQECSLSNTRKQNEGKCKMQLIL